MKKLTEKQYDMLNLAIASATNPGACVYTKNGEPCCVIGQLAVLDGAGMSAADDVETGKVKNGYGIEMKAIEYSVVVDHLGLEDYPKELLQALQVRWDVGYERNVLGGCVDKYVRDSGGLA